ncbi:MAG: aminoacyl-tRNA hydrolase [SAR324 cluster bacterium]|uniref:Peptidyl-tRNA hydrolase n=1 Tax=SAR324 cluster bacterium TaxID=2024889 RepID=A0A2A4TAS7_9DELT|nr:MAG: aminoacyl-tRNA hydrolase [SAR324 cluster bacterium]
MKIIVGLGNPGKKYEGTLHNAGFAAIDCLAETLGALQWTQRFKGLVAQGRYQGESFILLKPQTYMNVSGESVLACKQFFKADLEDVLVLSDDLDLAAGTLRYRAKGGHGGHNGLRNIIQLCGGNLFPRIKIGIGRPQGVKQVASYVLNKPPLEVQLLVEESIRQTTEYQLAFLKGLEIQIHQQAKLA